jgi:hypothetical protein
MDLATRPMKSSQIHKPSYPLMNMQFDNLGSQVGGTAKGQHNRLAE